jgi:hypothetical protein
MLKSIENDHRSSVQEFDTRVPSPWAQLTLLSKKFRIFHSQNTGNTGSSLCHLIKELIYQLHSKRKNRNYTFLLLSPKLSRLTTFEPILAERITLPGSCIASLGTVVERLPLRSSNMGIASQSRAKWKRTRPNLDVRTHELRVNERTSSS